MTTINPDTSDSSVASITITGVSFKVRVVKAGSPLSRDQILHYPEFHKVNGPEGAQDGWMLDLITTTIEYAVGFIPYVGDFVGSYIYLADMTEAYASDDSFPDPEPGPDYSRWTYTRGNHVWEHEELFVLQAPLTELGVQLSFHPLWNGLTSGDRITLEIESTINLGTKLIPNILGAIANPMDYLTYPYTSVIYRNYISLVKR
ncbi:MAG: hypothetical protein RBG13Loki_2656 [Promethearchaeota archaeon CR_4]|nr:MAG: hypothetical protein RBG13Loki_2656 [Candidatus Lokiarchaeota archaeon CR_4]